MKNNCPHCGSELPEGVTFCPVCARGLVEKREAGAPRPGAVRRLLPVCLAAVLALAAGLLLRPAPESPAQPEPPAQETAEAPVGEPAAEPEEAPAEQPEEAPEEQPEEEPARPEPSTSLTYTDGERRFLVVVSCTHDGVPTKEMTVTLNPGNETVVPAALMIYDGTTGEAANEAFLALVEHMTVEPETVRGGEVVCRPPLPMERFPNAAVVSELLINDQVEESRIHWTITMKTGEVLTLTHDILQQTRPVVAYHYEDHDMSTDAALQTLLEQIAAETESNATVKLYLPPVTYTQPVTFRDRNFIVLGALAGEGETTFANTVTLESQQKNVNQIQNVVFRGDGSGLGLDVAAPVELLQCSFFDWDVGVETRGCGVAELDGCALMGNGVGLHYNTEWYYWNIGICVNTEFRDNELAVDLEQYPGFDTLDFSGSTFYQNENNILNRPDFQLDLTGVIME